MKRSLLALTLLAALPFAASAADGVSYTYVEGGYAATNPDGSTDADGWALKGSGAIAPNFHLFGEYTTQEFDNTNVDLDNYKFGVGYNHEISQRIDLLTRQKDDIDAAIAELASCPNVSIKLGGGLDFMSSAKAICSAFAHSSAKRRPLF